MCHAHFLIVPEGRAGAQTVGGEKRGGRRECRPDYVTMRNIDRKTATPTPACGREAVAFQVGRRYFPGSANATSPVCSPCPVANTMYCLPLYMNVIGTAVLTVGIATEPTSLPVALSKA